MQEITQRFSDNTRVKLKDDIEPDFYNGYGRVGNEGWITKHQRDPHGYPMVYIQWDKDHWAYNGAPDKWTWEDHFDLVKEPMSQSSKADSIRELVAAFGEQLAAVVDDGPVEAQVVEDTDPEFEEVVKSAFASASESEGFILVTLKDNVEDEALEPLIFHASKDEKASLLLQLQLAQLTVSFQQRLVMAKLRSSEE